MLKRYARPEMAALWSDKTKFGYWLKVELAVLQAKVELGMISMDVYLAIKMNAAFTVGRIEEIEEETQHDMIAFVMTVQEALQRGGVGECKERFHEGNTSYDVEDPATILMLREAGDLILNAIRQLEEALRAKACEHQWTYMMARTHGKYAEPATFGQFLLTCAEEAARNRRRLEQVLQDELSEGKMSGAVGTYSGLSPALEAQALTLLGLKPARAETQILQRDRHAALLSVLAITASGIERMVRSFWEWMRDEVRELEEPRGAKQKGSSAMPHKKNPIKTEQLMGLARLLRANAQTAMENIATPEWRDISQSSVERHIFADSTSLLHYMLIRATNLVSKLVVFPERMESRIHGDSHGVWASQPVRIALMHHGVSYADAYEATQRAAFTTVERQVHYHVVLAETRVSDTDHRCVASVLGHELLMECFDYKKQLEPGIKHLFRAD